MAAIKGKLSKRTGCVNVYNFSLQDVSEILGKHPSSVVSEIKRGRLSAIRTGRTFRFSEDDLKDYFERSRVPVPASVSSSEGEQP
jgi:excisionase family DNA binding protein